MTSGEAVRIRAGSAEDRAWVVDALTREWGRPEITSRGSWYHADRLPALVAERAGRPVGLLTYRIDAAELEVMTLQAFEQRSGVGSALLRAARNLAREAGCLRLWLVTTNDNTSAMRFYAAMEMRLRAVHRGAMTRARELKPDIPLLGHGGVPIEDEIEYEWTNEAIDGTGSWTHWHSADTPLRLGVSACLLGDEVRYDAGHARDRFVVETLGRWFEFVRACPEMEIGMGTPRPTIRLEDEGGGIRLIAPSTGEDFTDRMNAYAARKIRELTAVDLDGYVLKKSSPSCGLERIRVYRGGRVDRRDAAGLFAAKLLELWPALPVEDEGRLNDPAIRENFMERVFCRNRWRALVRRGLTRRRLVEFHTAHKLLVFAHHETAARRMGRLVGEAGKTPDRELFALYEMELQTAMRARATPRKHANVQQHALGHLKKMLAPAEKREILSAIDDFRCGLLPLVVPLTLLRFNIRRHGVQYLLGQLYFDPHPKELMLRNHA
jgi:uncharacterized protein YbgA (DUF1722 family)/uncharacterized protein YbbK (DUF523 family)/GNAT superfamily N-acetyltransferase